MIIKLGKYKLNLCWHKKVKYTINNIEVEICAKCDKVFKNKRPGLKNNENIISNRKRS